MGDLREVRDMTYYGRYSFWLETCDDDLTPRPPLDGSLDVDVAILGADFGGLWTAYYLLGAQPSLRVRVLMQWGTLPPPGLKGQVCPITCQEVERTMWKRSAQL
jgi:hypothetical protein